MAGQVKNLTGLYFLWWDEGRPFTVRDVKRPMKEPRDCAPSCYAAVAPQGAAPLLSL